MCIQQFSCLAAKMLYKLDIGRCDMTGLAHVVDEPYVPRGRTLTCMLSSHRRHGKDKARLSCLVRVGGVN